MTVLESAILIGSFLMLILLGVPIAISLGVAALLTALHTGMDPVMIAQRVAASLQSFPLIAIPLFILAGAIMARGGVARRIVDFAYILVGPFPGGLAMVNCIDSMFFGGVSGSAVADISSTGPIMIPMMVEKGYDRAFATALTVASSTQGIIIPPSHNMVIYAMVAGGVSVGQLFLAGYLPGIMLGVFLAVTCYLLALKYNYPREKMPPFRKALRISIDGMLSLLAAVIIVGGIAFGIFTATEASAVAVFYAAFLGLCVYRELKLKDIWPIFLDSVKTTASVLLLIGCASAFGWMMTLLQVPTHVTGLFLSVTDNPLLLLLLINILLLLLGMIMDVAPLILIITPVLLPVVQAAGMSPITFGVLLMLNLGIGLTTPPVGAGLFVGCSVGKVSMEQCSKMMLYLWPAMLLVLLLVTYFPWFTTFIPSLFPVK
ncbi:tripartite ATP-independent transporter DctM subunit [Hydrogenispora ethanolica]|uniref:Tripartite ATP-independent transporter DctM subunit n=1 Tax=Hydrogenispora ethanolica TaxID=1082276 RepID=A0A4R1RBW3_HYDET|nr:TRAP transporter large permease [Hydrogenispora ethanolica]TCL63285.1 tripartite ATP-independent transporter DctM subunit [Hydrogenispora ethanolica]